MTIDLLRNDITRRGAMGALGGGALMAAGWPGLARAETPKRGGHLRYGVSTGSTADSLDPATYISFNMYVAALAIGNCLVEIDAGKRPIPELAESWEDSDGAKKWVFKLRQGVEFHNGKTFTAHDAVFSLNRHRGEDTKSSMKPLLASVSDIHADDDRTLVIELSEGNADMPMILASYHLIMVPDGSDDWSTLIGTGGYTLDGLEAGVRLTTKRNPNYWKADRAWVDSFEMLSIIDPTARTNALMTGEVDVIDRVDTKTVRRLERMTDRFTLVPNPGVNYQACAMDARAAPFDNVDVRAALKYLVKRDELLDKINKGYGQLGNDHPVPPNDPYFNAELPQREYDPEKAKHHLKKAGVDKLAVALSASDTAYTGAVDAAVLMQESATAAGVDIEVIREPNDGYWSNVWLKKPFCAVNWIVRPSPAMHFSIAYACGAPWADGFFCHDRFEMLLKEARLTTDFDKRKEILGEMQQIQRDEGSNIVMNFVSSLDLYSNSVEGMGPDAAAATMGARVAERVWMA